MRSILIYAILLIGIRARNLRDDEGSKETNDDPVMDRLAKNLAGAFVKSLLPDLELSSKPTSSQDVRRMSSSYEQNPSVPNANYYPPQYQFPNSYGPITSGMYSPNVPPISPQMTQPYPLVYHPALNPTYAGTSMQYSARPPNPFSAFGPASQNGIPYSAEYQPFALSGLTLNKMIAPLASGNGDIESLNRARNENYRADLLKHQQDLMQYGEKQMEYLDQQRRYQQAMLDQQAGAALLLQKQQEELLKKRQNALRHLKHLEKQAAYKQKSQNLSATHESSDNSGIPYDQQTGGEVLLIAKENNPMKRYAARNELNRHFLVSRDDEDEIVDDEKLKEFLKQNHGINVLEDGAKLAENERKIIRDLKQHLTSDAYEQALAEGVLKSMSDFKKNYSGGRELFLCDKCIPVNISDLKGTWTQIYGNPNVLWKTYSTILSLRSTPLKSRKTMTTNLTKRKASCVGLKVGEAAHRSASMQLFFRDDSRVHELHEMSGTFKSDGTVLEWDLSALNMKTCVVKAGPKQSEQFDYIILTETTGTNKCTSYHIFTRNSDQFSRKYHSDIDNFMKTEVLHGTVLPVARLPKAHLCDISDNI